MQTLPGWYPDPDGVPGRMRWWNGVSWSDVTTTAGDSPGLPTDQVATSSMSETPTRSLSSAHFLAGIGETSVRRLRPQNDRRWRMTIAGALVAILLISGLWIVIGKQGRLDTNPGQSNSASDASVPQLEKLCGNTPTAQLSPGPAQHDPSGPRVLDSEAGISYMRLGSPWQQWDQNSWVTGNLRVRYDTGYYFVAQPGAPTRRGNYLATVLSASVVAAAADSVQPNLGCVSRQLAEDVRQTFYPTPTTMQILRDESTAIDGHYAHIIEFQLSFHADGYNATGERVGLLAVDVGRAEVAILYLSIPDTHAEYNSIINQVFSSVRVD